MFKVGDELHVLLLHHLDQNLGTVTCDIPVHKGSTFSIYLPTFKKKKKIYIYIYIYIMLIGVKWYLVVDLICVTSDVKLLLWFLAICVSSLETCLFKFFLHVLIEILLLLLSLSSMISLYILDINPYQIYNLFIFSPSIVLHSVDFII